MRLLDVRLGLLLVRMTQLLQLHHVGWVVRLMGLWMCDTQLLLLLRVLCVLMDHGLVCVMLQVLLLLRLLWLVWLVWSVIRIRLAQQVMRLMWNIRCHRRIDRIQIIEVTETRVVGVHRLIQCMKARTEARTEVTDTVVRTVVKRIRIPAQHAGLIRCPLIAVIARYHVVTRWRLHHVVTRVRDVGSKQMIEASVDGTGAG
jgi:hypothetical protein